MAEMKMTVTLELTKEDRQRLDVISDTLELIRLALTTRGTPFPAPEPVKEAQQEAAGAMQEEPALVHTPEPEQPAEPQEPAKTVKLSDIQQKVVALSAAGKKAEVREIVKEYAERVSGIPADKLSEVWDKLTALEG